MQNNQPTHFIEAWATIDEYKEYNKTNTCINTAPLLMRSLDNTLNHTNFVTTIHTVAIFKVYPKNN